MTAGWSGRRRFLRAGAITACLVLIAVTSRVATTSAAPLHDILAKFDWTGTYDLVGTGFPDGERHAVLFIAQQDTSYALHSLQGPPGFLVSFKVAGDSAHVVWNLGPEEMLVDLRGSGDSLTGEWSTRDWRGEVRGVRRR